MPRNSHFQFKQFRVDQHQCGMKVTSDASLFGGFVASRAGMPRQILDVGAGSGLLALMLAQACPRAIVHAVEASGPAARQCAANFERSPWRDRLEVFETRIQDYRAPHEYDLIISNPPFARGQRRGLDAARNMARHQEDALPLEDLVVAARAKLAPDVGRFWVLLPPQGHHRLARVARGGRLSRVSNVAVRDSPAKQPHLSIACYRRNDDDDDDDDDEALVASYDDVLTHCSFITHMHPYYLIFSSPPTPTTVM
ncbi:hypothetical protein CTAYLR_002948 [Chrysophaeum taylorii]|uniref:Methyltransferase small domain-containing protein n=1 Tax=Chrysophaeum taylorii TaxID=2483200 RepID=A0AAD7UNL0_9STRA|nr:hypothetical protein CTAYLR_002948 [Chrysophaeum taylorii]